MRGKGLKKITGAVAVLAFAAITAFPAAAARQAVPLPAVGGPYYYTTPPRFQIFHAPGAFGGLIMVDTKTGETFQRVTISTPKGVVIKWMKLDKMDKLGPEESLQWQ